jgi:hypothetical protein
MVVRLTASKFKPLSQSQSHITTDCQSVCLGVKPNLGLLIRDDWLFSVLKRKTVWADTADSNNIIVL